MVILLLLLLDEDEDDVEAAVAKMTFKLGQSLWRSESEVESSAESSSAARFSMSLSADGWYL